MTRRTLGISLIALAALMGVSALYLHSGARPLVFSDAQMLEALWNTYKETYIEPGTFRTIDRQRGDITTSEGQSYTMLRAVWMGDKEIFDGAWKWTEDNLSRPDTELFSWLFGKRPDGTFGVLSEQGGSASATDADSDIALALIFAYARWQEERYLAAAQAIVSDLWEYSVIDINGTPYLLANDVEKSIEKNLVIVNPSYLSPYAYRLFAHVDPEHPWNALVDGSYDLLARSMEIPLGTSTTTGLPPDWIALDRRTGEITPVGSETLTTNYGYDALRTPWRVALDWHWFHEPRAKETLARMETLQQSWEMRSALPAVIARDGRILESQEIPAAYGGSISYFLVENPHTAREIYETKLLPLYDPDINEWRTPLSYYDDNWAWFGIALYTGSLPNLAASLCPLILETDTNCLELRATTHQSL